MKVEKSLHESGTNRIASVQIKINKKHRSIYSYNIQIYASSQSRVTQALYQIRYEQYFETLKLKQKKPLDLKLTIFSFTTSLTTDPSLRVCSIEYNTAHSKDVHPLLPAI